LGKSYPTIAFHPEKCNGCNDCVEACVQIKTDTRDPVHSRIRVAKDSEDEFYGISLCRQCGDPRCVMDCPARALTKSEDTGVVLWDETKCVNCQLCTLACPYAGITYNRATDQVMKCDLCQGDPACVKACEPKALEYKIGAEIYNTWGDLEDLFVPGVSACLGCNSELIMRHTLRRVGPNTVLATPPGCIPGVGAVGVNGVLATKTPVFHPLLTNTAAMLAGAKRYYNRIGRDVTPHTGTHGTCEWTVGIAERTGQNQQIHGAQVQHVAGGDTGADLYDRGKHTAFTAGAQRLELQAGGAGQTDPGQLIGVYAAFYTGRIKLRIEFCCHLASPKSKKQSRSVPFCALFIEGSG